MHVTPQKAPAKLAYSINEAVDATSICRSKLYELIKAGELPVKKVGKRTLILADALSALLAG